MKGGRFLKILNRVGVKQNLFIMQFEELNNNELAEVNGGLLGGLLGGVLGGNNSGQNASGGLLGGFLGGLLGGNNSGGFGSFGN
ncbi:hypothetical protein A3SI_19416 [Nitritalea halalkaliphila LW7]|uniref:Bacteriocin n=2 Tax=Nitritalea TaxID=1187887 RepID=I5BT60_9BACT|nr:hypothetical protein A3SI_19416 [Nitritalea halalkaliphila LW7]